MTFDVALAGRIRAALLARNDVTEKKMFGGLCFMVKGHMCCGVESERLMLRVGQERTDAALARAHARPMDFTGKPLKGFVFVSLAGVKTKRQLESWLALALENIESLPARPARKHKIRKGR
jgi:TfoX/Sxy family transcriptional regulator of competence genes